MTFIDIRYLTLFYYSLLVFYVFNLYRGTSQTYHCKDITTRMLVIWFKKKDTKNIYISTLLFLFLNKNTF